MEKELIRWLGENFEISQQENESHICVYMHDLTTISTDMLSNLRNFDAFDGIDLRDGYLTITVRKDVPTIADICRSAIQQLRAEIDTYEEGLTCSIEFLNKVTDIMHGHQLRMRYLPCAPMKQRSASVSLVR